MAQQVREWLGIGREDEPESRSQQVILITGAASGIGKECLRWFAREGYHCVGIDLRFENEPEFMKSLSFDDKNFKINLEHCDVANYDEFHRIVERYEKDHGYIHCLVNNAGVKFIDSIDKQNKDEWSRMLDVNVMGVLNGIRCVVDKMKEKKQGCIINIGDIGSHKNYPNHTVYCATKFAVQGITEGVRRELMDYNVKVVAINPGAVETPLFSQSTDKNLSRKNDQWKDSLKLGVLQPEDVARCCLFAFQQPKRCLVREIQLAPLEQDM